MAKAPTKIAVETLTHDDATRKNIPTAEHQSIMHEAISAWNIFLMRRQYEILGRRNR